MQRTLVPRSGWQASNGSDWRGSNAFWLVGNGARLSCKMKSWMNFFFSRKTMTIRNGRAFKMIIWVIGVLRWTAVGDWRFDNLCGLTLKMAFAQVVETSVASNSPFQDSNHQMIISIKVCSNHFHSQAFISHAFEFCRIKPDGDILQTRCQKNEKVRRLIDCETDHSLIVTFSDFLTSWQKEISIHRRHVHIHILSHAKWSCDVSMCKMCPQIFRSLNERRWLYTVSRMAKNQHTVLE